MQTRFSINTDGGCRCNPGIGAWAFIVTKDDEIIYRSSGYKEFTTNNEMELTALFEAEKWIVKNTDDTDVITIYSDSQYTVNTVNVWYNAKVAKKSEKKIINYNLIKSIMDIHNCHKNRLKLKWVRGHSGNKYNEMADVMVNDEMDAMR